MILSSGKLNDTILTISTISFIQVVSNFIPSSKGRRARKNYWRELNKIYEYLKVSELDFLDVENVCFEDLPKKPPTKLMTLHLVFLHLE